MIRALGRDGHVVRRDELPHPLFLAQRVHFGTLPAARRAAGLAPVRLPRKWSAERVINELRALDRRGIVMRAWEIDEAGPPGLLFALYECIGSLKHACRLAGVPRPPRRRFDDRWDEDSVIEAIRCLHRAGKPVAMSKVDPRLYAAGRRFFARWSEAIETAGLDYDKVRLVREAYTRKEVIALLRQLAKKRPKMVLHEVARHRYGRAARKAFGSTARGVAAAGVKGWPPTALPTNAPCCVSRYRGPSLARGRDSTEPGDSD